MQRAELVIKLRAGLLLGEGDRQFSGLREECYEEAASAREYAQGLLERSKGYAGQNKGIYEAEAHGPLIRAAARAGYDW
jgi:hypothetical protein